MLISDILKMFQKNWSPIVHDGKVRGFCNNKTQLQILSEQLDDAYNEFNHADPEQIDRCITKINTLSNEVDRALYTKIREVL